jgi:hypothetical protein
MIGGLLKSASSTALFAALGLVALGAGAPAAKAADLGGDCCADLEERVAELEATTARKGNRKVSVTISGQVTTELMYWNDGGSVNKQGPTGIFGGTSTVPGKTNASDLYVVDNTASIGGSQFGLTGSAAINPNLTAGFQINIGLDRGARSNHVSQNSDDGESGTSGLADTTIVLTHANWYLDHKQLGRITVGRANTATSGLTGIDLGGAGVIAGGATQGYWNANFQLISTGTLLNAQWGDLMGTGRIWGSGLSRANVISYTSPTLSGFTFGAAWGENDLWDAALRYAGEFSGFRIAAGVGYTNNVGGFGEANNGSDLPTNTFLTPSAWKGSASVLHVASGLFLTGAYMDQNNDNGSHTTMWYAQGGISKNYTGLGNTVLYGEYSVMNDGILACGTGGTAGYVGGGCRPIQDYGLGTSLLSLDVFTGSEVSIWGIGIVQNIDAAAMELYLSYRHYEGSADTAHTPFLGATTHGTINYSDLDMVMGGARIRF